MSLDKYHKTEQRNMYLLNSQFLNIAQRKKKEELLMMFLVHKKSRD